MQINHWEKHRVRRIGWLRAAVLGANDGIISTSSLLMGVAAAQSTHEGILIAGVAGLIAGAMSMAAGEYISVSSQADTEKADLLREKKELEANFTLETEELTGIYMSRGLDRALAEKVAKQLMAHDALGAHARDELGITERTFSNPLQAAISSAFSFALGAALPLIVTIFTPLRYLIATLSVMTIIFLAFLGLVAAMIGGSRKIVGALRVMLWGSLAMLISAGIGSIMGVVL